MVFSLFRPAPGPGSKAASGNGDEEEVPEQCVTFGSDPRLNGQSEFVLVDIKGNRESRGALLLSFRAVTGFTLFFLLTVYFLPLLVMVVTYSRFPTKIVFENKSNFHA